MASMLAAARRAVRGMGIRKFGEEWKYVFMGVYTLGGAAALTRNQLDLYDKMRGQGARMAEFEQVTSVRLAAFNSRFDAVDQWLLAFDTKISSLDALNTKLSALDTELEMLKQSVDNFKTRRYE